MSIIDTAAPDRAQAIAEAVAVRIPFHCSECGHDWQSATSNDCPVCAVAEPSPFDRVENAFQNWWQRQGHGDKAQAHAAWMGGATAGIDSVRGLL